MAAKSGIIKDDNGNQFCPATKTNMIVDDDGNRLDAIIAGLVKNDGTRAYGTWDINIYGSAHYLDVKRQIWGQDFNATADIKNVMIKYATGIGYSTTRQIELSSGLVKVNDTLNAASASFSGNVTDAAIHYFANGTTYYVNASGAAKFNGTNTGALTATTGEFTSRVHTTSQVVGDGGVFAGGIGDLQEDGWTTPVLTNGTHGTTYGEVRYRKIGTNVQIDGSFTITWDGSSQFRLFNLPSGYNPSHNMTGWLYNNSNGIWRYVIGTDGWVSLINIKSIADGSNITSATTCMFDNMIFPLN